MTYQPLSRNPLYTTGLALAAAVMLCAAPATQADPMGHGYGDHGMGMMHHGEYDHGYGHEGYMMRPHNAAIHYMKMGRMLNLTGDQYKKLKEMRDDYIQKNSVAEQQLKADRSDLKWLLHADKFDRDSIDKKMATIGKLESQLWRAYLDQLQAIDRMLTADQKAALKDMYEHRGRGMGGHPDMGIHPRGMGMGRNM